ncbi:hexosaminidase [Chitinophaga skermanii]|uniref:beta-N-acetylhexosaminidase n=2 Tax=Chitinophaga skermanii TaxID=331697 RepID=A0A327QD31_9BACT|nr:hexosaminidase [Chitinophaga skermanii]
MAQAKKKKKPTTHKRTSVKAKPAATAPSVALQPILPEPADAKTLSGSFTVTPKVKVFTQGAAAEKTLDLLNTFLEENYGFKLNATAASANEDNTIIITEDATYTPVEGYNLTISGNKVQLKGQGAGLFYGLQTFLQLLPVEHTQKIVVSNVIINDEPRFGYRGLMLDVCRHFYPIKYVKKFIDVMAQYKMNRLHFHLTDDQGWRIEIKKYPRLTAVGSTRKGSLVGHLGQSSTFDNVPHGGFYTQAELRDLVAYAAERYVTIIPEIEMPGHALAALAAYPNLGCTGGPYEVSGTWGVFKDVYCAGNEETFTFLQNVLDEVLTIFPSPIIHIGGDECPKDSWKKCPKCQQRMKQNNLKDEHALQSYFVQRMEKYLNGKGRNIIGWDEILEGGLAPNAAVMSWRGEEGGIAAAKLKHNVVMTPNNYVYLDYYQASPKNEPILNIGGYLPLSRVYNYEPLPAELTEEEKKYIIGFQGNLWTEYLSTEDQVDYMVYPRALAIAETGWSPANKKDYDAFLGKLKNVLFNLDQQGVHYRIPEPAGLADVVTAGTSVRVDLKPPVTGAVIRYTIDGSEPTTASSLFTKPFNFPLAKGQTITLRCIVVLPSGRVSNKFSATYMSQEYKAGLPVNPAQKGVKFQAAFKPVKSLANLAFSKVDTSGFMQNISINAFQAKPGFTVQYDGYIKIDEDGVYEISTKSDDGSMLYLDDELVVNNDGEHGEKEEMKQVPLRKGFHKIRVSYFDAGGGKTLQVNIGMNGKAPVSLRNNLFYEN